MQTLVRAVARLFVGAAFCLLPAVSFAIEEAGRDMEISISAEDNTNGGSGEITVVFTIFPRIEGVERVVVERSELPNGGFVEVAELESDETRFVDSEGIDDNAKYYYRAKAIRLSGGSVTSSVCGPVSSPGLWFKPGACFTGALSAATVLAMLFFLFLAKSGRSMYIRPIPGLQAIEEAIGRAPEMGKPILYCSGVADLRCPGVLASLTVLGWVAEEIARYGAALTYPVNNALSLTAGQEVVKESYLRAGRPEAYQDSIVYFISGEQFAYAAAVCGVMERERPAANFFFGSFWSESLILTESGASTGAMQIAALDTEHQIPFMVATCDYVIIGEEFYAASAYLSPDPGIKGSLKALDLIKLVIVLLILAGVAAYTFKTAIDADFDWFFRFFGR